MATTTDHDTGDKSLPHARLPDLQQIVARIRALEEALREAIASCEGFARADLLAILEGG